jgi:hypothetical protein
MMREVLFRNEVHTDCYCDRVALLVNYGSNTISEVVTAENIKTGVFLECDAQSLVGGYQHFEKKNYRLHLPCGWRWLVLAKRC